MVPGSQGDVPEERPYFFDEGIRFACTDCGRCCTGAPGATISVNADEQAALAARLHVTQEALLRDYLRAEGTGHSIREAPNGDCVFFADGRCSIYSVRPTQCRTYPFWFKNMRSEERWERTRRECPGIGRGRLFDREEILALIEEDLGSGRPQVMRESE